MAVIWAACQRSAVKAGGVAGQPPAPQRSTTLLVSRALLLTCDDAALASRWIAHGWATAGCGAGAVAVPPGQGRGSLCCYQLPAGGASQQRCQQVGEQVPAQGCGCCQHRWG